MAKNRVAGRIISSVALAGGLLVAAGTAPAQADPELCTQHSYGKICVQRYPTTNNIRTTFYNNRGGANTLYLGIVRYPSAIVKMSDWRTVPYGGTTSISFTYKDESNTFQGYFRAASGESAESPWT